MLFCVVSLLAYKKGDVIDSQTIQALKMEEGKVYIIDFFASWCHSCKREMPTLSTLSRKIDPKKVELIGVDVDEDITLGKAFQRELRSQNKLTFRVLNDFEGKIVSQFAPIGIPALYIIKNGKIIAVEVGAKDHIDTIVLKHLKEIQ